MGLESVELVVALEEAFGIDIPDEAATGMVTVQDVVDYIAEHVPTIPDQSCHTREIFYKLREGFGTQTSSPTNEFRPETKLKRLVRKGQWPGVWTAVRNEVGEDFWPETIVWPGFLWKRGPATIRALVYCIAFHLPKPNAKLGEPWTRERIALAVREVVRDVLAVVDFKHDAKLSALFPIF